MPHQTKLYLTRVPWDNTYSDARFFTSVNDQKTYFTSGSNVLDFDEKVFRFIDGDGTDSRKRDVKIPLTAEEAQSYNYAFYSNDGGTTYNYMFIISADYVNYETTILHLEEDLIQNYMFNFKFNECHIDRETPLDDIEMNWMGSENLNEDISFVYSTENIFSENFLYYVCCSERLVASPSSDPQWRLVKQQMNASIENVDVPYGFIFFNQLIQLNRYLDCCKEAARLSLYNMDSILSIGAVSKSIVSDECILELGNYTTPYYLPQTLQGSDKSIADITKILYCRNWEFFYGGVTVGSVPTRPSVVRYKTYKIPKPNRPQLVYRDEYDDIGMYTVKNKKLFSSPFFGVSIESPGKRSNFYFDQVYYEPVEREGRTVYERSDTITFKFLYTFSPAESFKCIMVPLFYNGQAMGQNTEDYQGFVEVPVGGSLPFAVDTYTQWLTANSLNLSFDKLTSMYKGVGEVINKAVDGASVGGGFGAAAGAGLGLINATFDYERIKNQELQEERSSYRQMFGDSTDNTLCVFNRILPKIALRQINPKRVKKLDAYFAKFGYAVNKSATPRIKNRRNWDYIKTIDCKIVPNGSDKFMTTSAKLQIQNIFNNGIRFWHKNEVGEYGDYTNPGRS